MHVRCECGGGGLNATGMDRWGCQVRKGAGAESGPGPADQWS